MTNGFEYRTGGVFIGAADSVFGLGRQRVLGLPRATLRKFRIEFTLTLLLSERVLLSDAALLQSTLLRELYLSSEEEFGWILGPPEGDEVPPMELILNESVKTYAELNRKMHGELESFGVDAIGSEIEPWIKVLDHAQVPRRVVPERSLAFQNAWIPLLEDGDSIQRLGLGELHPHLMRAVEARVATGKAVGRSNPFDLAEMLLASSPRNRRLRRQVGELHRVSTVVYQDSVARDLGSDLMLPAGLYPTADRLRPEPGQSDERVVEERIVDLLAIASRITGLQVREARATREFASWIESIKADRDGVPGPDPIEALREYATKVRSMYEPRGARSKALGSLRIVNRWGGLLAILAQAVDAPAPLRASLQTAVWLSAPGSSIHRKLSEGHTIRSPRQPEVRDTAALIAGGLISR